MESLRKFAFFLGAFLMLGGFLGGDKGAGVSLLGLAVFALPFVLQLLWGGAKLGARATTAVAKVSANAGLAVTKAGAGAIRNAAVHQLEKVAEEREYQKQQRRKQQEWEQQLQRDLIREEKLARARNQSQLEAYRAQVELLVEFKKKGADIDKEILAMREKLIGLEKQENNDMIATLVDTLNHI